MMATAETPACCFTAIFDCSVDNSALLTGTQARIESIIVASRVRGDGFHEQLEASLHDRSSTHSVYVHKNCVSTYTSKTHIQRYVSKHSQQTTPEEPQRKKIKRSDITTFDFRRHCLFCGEECKTEVEPRHPYRWRRVVQCRTANRGEDKTFKQGILDVCDQRNDEQAHQVRLRVQGAVSDLHAADAQYHKDCEAIFMSPPPPQYSGS